MRTKNNKNQKNSTNVASQTAPEPQKKKKTPKIPKSIKTIFIILLICIAGYLLITRLYMPKLRLDRINEAQTPDWIDVQLITLDGVSREGIKLDGYNDIVVHYVGNPGSTAQNNRDFFEGPESDVSSHFVVGLEGEIIQCIPLNEKSAASNHRNHDTISIEVCHPDDTGKFNDATYNSLVRLVAWLADIGYLSEDHIIRHYDVTGKECPKYFVNNEDAWEQFKTDVKKYRAAK